VISSTVRVTNTVLTLLPVKVFYDNFAAHVAVICVVMCVCVWNGGNASFLMFIAETVQYHRVCILMYRSNRMRHSELLFRRFRHALPAAGDRNNQPGSQ